MSYDSSLKPKNFLCTEIYRNRACGHIRITFFIPVGQIRQFHLLKILVSKSLYFILCITYYPQNSGLKHQIFVISCSFWGSWTWEHFGWVALAPCLSKTAIKLLAKAAVMWKLDWDWGVLARWLTHMAVGRGLSFSLCGHLHRAAWMLPQHGS